MNTLRQHFSDSMLTLRTFNTRSFWVYAYGLLAAFYRHCLQDIEERTPSDIENRFCQSSSIKPFNAQVFKSNQVVFGTKPVCNLVVKLFA